jgi:hypothetical protein
MHRIVTGIDSCQLSGFFAILVRFHEGYGDATELIQIINETIFVHIYTMNIVFMNILDIFMCIFTRYLEIFTKRY